ncbi:hypothetical protein [Pseudomonas khavaziana]|uniref:hypothetical protein n=1 Tax=Pseudomonas khavaziana TaxID=2842351 RepID=UPI001C3C3BB9|nr:hypothetical protein [Pseudomonas khavaziana]MBV4478479.1 hypothetical protein [Pseudomonas khavaziana]
MNSRNVRLEEFAIESDLGGVYTSELYANGRHQCKLYIRLIKKLENALGGWDVVPLTSAEKASATVQLFSPNPAIGLPAGWSCDVEKNQFDCGLWPQSGQTEAEVQEIAINPPSGAPLELLERYVRVAQNAITDTKRFMASIVIDGKVYTTYYNDDNVLSNSFVDITPVKPYVLRVAQLQRFIDIVDLSHVEEKLRAQICYWQPPASLYFVESLGLTAPLDVPDEGASFQTAFVFWAGRGGVARDKNVLGTPLFLSDVKRIIAPGKDTEIEFNLQPTAMRAVVLFTDYFDHRESAGTWRVVDNFGCEHSYRMVFGTFGDPVKLTD